MASRDTDKADHNLKPVIRTFYDPTLDFCSEQFDPIKALNTPGVVPPDPKAKTYDNLSQWQRAQEPKPINEKVKAASSNSVVERKWLPHQLPIKKKLVVSDKSVFTKMDTIKGPLQLLKKCIDEHLQIKVFTRHSHDIRGFCVAYVTLFDKHWNMVLKDVTEVWKRPKRKKIPAGLDHASISDSVKKGRRIVPPAITVIATKKKSEICQRYVNQLLIRGEHVASIVVLPRNCNKPEEKYDIAS